MRYSYGAEGAMSTWLHILARTRLTNDWAVIVSLLTTIGTIKVEHSSYNV
jgi:hypothetical protein